MLKNTPYGLAHIAIPAGDFKETVSFYHTLGFLNVEMHEYTCILQNGNCFLEIYRRRSEEQEAGAIDHIALSIRDIDNSYEEISLLGYKIITNGIESNQMFEPKTNRFFKFFGPNNEIIEFTEVTE